MLKREHLVVGIAHGVTARGRHLWSMSMGEGPGFSKRSSEPLFIYMSRSLRMREPNADKHFSLALYCLKNSLGEFMVRESQNVLHYSPDHMKAHALLGEVLDKTEGRWVKAEKLKR